jgi:predicted permease
MAVRLALGGGRRRLIRQLLSESALLAGAGGMVGIILAYWASDALVAFMSRGANSVQLHVSPDLRVLGFTGLISALTVILFGLAPSLGATRLELTEALKEGSGSAVGTRGRWRAVRLSFRGSLVVSQVAISVVLLIGAGLFLQTLTNLVNQNLGFDRRNLLLFRIDPSQSGYKGERLASFYQELQRRIEALPGVRSASLSLHSLIGGGFWTHGISIPGYIPKPGEATNGSIEVPFQLVGSGFFETLGIPLVLGRTISDVDITNAPRVCVINQAFAQKYFGNSNPIGRQLGFGGTKSSSGIAVVGVVGNTKYDQLSHAPPPTVYISFPQYLDRLGAMYFEVRTVGNPKEWISSVRQVVRGLDKRVPLVHVETQREQIDDATFQARLFASVTGFFALLTLLLACVGLYGNLAYAVSQRTNEIGVRMALGGQPHSIIALVLRQGAELTLIGLGIGAIVALALSRLIASFLFGLAPTDPLAFASAAVLLTVAALLACYIPARRAAKVDPMVALRYE